MTFFSGTDTNTLRSEGSIMNNFVSLIVNNAGTYTAAITRLVHNIKDVRASKTYRFFGEGEVDMGSSQYYEDDYTVEYFKLDIEKHIGYNNEILARLKEIKDSKGRLVSVSPITTNNPIKEFNIPKNENTHKFNPPKEASLFSDYDFDQMIDYNTEISKDIVESALLQIITGSIIVTTKNKLDIKNWVSKIDSIFKGRFPEDASFEYWVDTHIDAVLSTTNLDELDEIPDSDVRIAILAYQINLILKEYKDKSDYIAKIHEIVERYILI